MVSRVLKTYYLTLHWKRRGIRRRGRTHCSFKMVYIPFKNRKIFEEDFNISKKKKKKIFKHPNQPHTSKHNLRVNINCLPHFFQLISDFGGVQSENDLVNRLVSFHSGTIHLSEYDIGRLIFNVGENFRQFAVKQPTFQVQFCYRSILSGHVTFIWCDLKAQASWIYFVHVL